ncbi:hypothetical protein LTR53_006157 [Teratosphaeriaceae sp. CCFEE 6253]|nr:hypothetical protein LTR53_006157 [Teratosphaeriaceae sp. CCFEE 6253]
MKFTDASSARAPTAMAIATSDEVVTTLDIVYLASPATVPALAETGVAGVRSAPDHISAAPSSRNASTAMPSSHPSPVIKALHALLESSISDSSTKCITDLLRLHGKLGRLSKSTFTVFDRATTPNAMCDIKALLAQSDLEPETALVLATYRPNLASLKWSFDDVFDAFDFLGAYGRDDDFNMHRATQINFLESMDFRRHGECCKLPNREREVCCDPETQGACLKCACHMPGPSDGELLDRCYPGPLAFYRDLTLPSAFAADDFDALDRPACRHHQSYRFFSFLATRLMHLGSDPSVPDEVNRLRRTVIHRWLKKQAKSGWDFTGREFPPDGKALSMSLECDNGVRLQYMLRLVHGENEARMLAYIFVGQFELLM